ncbi:hypothetical protein COY33_01760 [candidate division WWE3 bacterium CG_4_10_14_0_2_um_filter_42_7]|uniref:Uncharacterized protein n=2 Tax=Katanobacteria TaxID=422282 RepID=A0A2H0X8R7_UNCKA|nr:MAG: hypothetical protein COT51_03340 [candidate division WWE3 bacterium CG08_land_8_20_14_0_20_41_15]PIZ43304.1 MAG: hypothetical protein COY33_01760 [candidate division WWE3 bacterium CG_4_10_14_0_2_um_filter_42_7]
MPNKLSRKKSSPKKDFFYWLPLITSIFVSSFWVAFGVVLSFFCFFSAAVTQNYGSSTSQVLLQFLPLTVPVAVIVGTIVHAIGYTKNQGGRLSKSKFAFNLLSLFFAIYIAQVFGMLGEYVSIKSISGLVLVTDVLWGVSLLLSLITAPSFIYTTK